MCPKIQGFVFKTDLAPLALHFCAPILRRVFGSLSSSKREKPQTWLLLKPQAIYQAVCPPNAAAQREHGIVPGDGDIPTLHRCSWTTAPHPCSRARTEEMGRLSVHLRASQSIPCHVVLTTRKGSSSLPGAGAMAGDALEVSGGQREAGDPGDNQPKTVLPSCTLLHVKIRLVT